MNNLRQAAQQALDALEQYKGVVVTHHDPESFRRMEVDGGQIARDAIAALRAALAEPEQEPVAWRTFDGEGGWDYRTYEDNQDYAAKWAKRNPLYVGWVEPLYTAPTPRKPLTDEEIVRICVECWRVSPRDIFFARAIERAHGIGEQT